MHEGSVRVPLTRGMSAVIDTADASLVAGYRWHAHRARTTWYARTETHSGGKKTVLYLHQLLAGIAGHGVDHRDGDGLNNRRSNLRPADAAQNGQNGRKRRPGLYKGVSWDRSRGKWIAGITVGGKRINAGRFATEEEAAQAYDALAAEHFGPFARLNFAVGAGEGASA